MNHWDNFIIITGKIGYVDDEDDIYEILLSSGDSGKYDCKSVFVVNIFSEILEDMIVYAKGNEITVIGCPVTDERCRITIYPDAIIVEDKLINKKKIYYPQDNDEEFSIKVLEDRFNEIKKLLSD